MANTALLIGALLLPTILGGAVLGAARLWRWQAARHRGPVAPGPPIERIAADIRRLRGEQGQLFAQVPGPGRGLRTRALNAAYVDVLIAACRALDLAPPQISGAGARATAEIRRVESALRLRGLDI